MAIKSRLAPFVKFTCTPETSDDFAVDAHFAPRARQTGNERSSHRDSSSTSQALYGIGMPDEIVEIGGSVQLQREPANGPTNREHFTSFDSALLRSSLEDGSLNLDCLNAREFFVMTRRYGLDGEPPHTYSQIGEILELSRESIRQDVNRATRKLQQVVRADHQ